MNLLSIDFNTLYKEQKTASTFKPKTKEEWDQKAPEMNRRIHQSIYNEQFLALVDTHECSTLLDIGCGPGNLALRFAKKLDRIWALDYSQQMLECMLENMRAKSIENIVPVQASWDEKWSDLPQCDIVVASRSMEVEDMRSALEKLNEKALKKVYLSYKVGGSFLEPSVAQAIGLDIRPKPDYIYIVNILYQMGIAAKVEFIESENKSAVYGDFDSFAQSVAWSVGELNEQQLQGLKEYFEVCRQTTQTSQPHRWAVISWEK